MKKILILIAVGIVIVITVLALSSNSEIKEAVEKGQDDAQNASQE